MNIKDIALRLQATDKFRLNISELSAQEFAEALVAELAKESEPVAEHELQDTRCECCGYMTYQREHMGCIRSSTPQPDRVAELEAALKVARDALRYYGGDKYGTFANEAYAKINEVLKP